MKKQYLTTLFILLIIIGSNSCNKDKTTPENFRLVSQVFTTYSNYPTISFSSESNVTYEGNHIKSNTLDKILKIELTYSGDSINENIYAFENNIWKPTSTGVLKYRDNLLATEYFYALPDKNKLSESIYNYEGDKIVEINGYNIIGDSSELHDSHKYYYGSGKLVQASFSFKAFPNQDIVENVKREFTYKDGDLYEELIYGDFNGYPIQLRNKKVYFYENKKITKVENRIFENNDFILSLIETREYDNYGNLVKIIETTVSGNIISEQILTYEVGGIFLPNLLQYSKWL
jgi:hypothetical protein